jgi:hypothetical protein
MQPSRRIGWQHAQTARHAQVQQQAAKFQIDQQVFGAPAHAGDALTVSGLRDARRYRPTQARLVHSKVLQAPTRDVRLDAAAGGFYFGQFGHRRRMPKPDAKSPLWKRAFGLLDLGLFVRDVLAHDRIVFLGFELLGVKTLVLHGHIEVAGARG